MFGFKADNPEQGFRGGVDSFGRGHSFLRFIKKARRVSGAAQTEACEMGGRPGQSRGGHNSQKKPRALVL